MSDVITESPAPGVCLVRINRPAARNALNLAVRERMAAAFTAANDAPEVRAIVVTGDETAFAAGADLRELQALDAAGALARRAPELMSTALSVATEIAALPPIGVQLIKEAILRGADQPLDAALAFERRSFQFLFATDDRKEGIAAFLERRKPDFRGR
jgi:enoyl-CoA hydratase/carnithine racemase